VKPLGDWVGVQMNDETTARSSRKEDRKARVTNEASRLIILIKLIRCRHPGFRRVEMERQKRKHQR
jgi:hypothetical protein